MLQDACLHVEVLILYLNIIVSFTALQQLTLTGIQAHIESPLEQVRHIGMAVGECVMNRFNPSDYKHKLKFEYTTNQDIESIKALCRPIAVQEKELKQIRPDKIPDPVQAQPLEDKSAEQQRVLSNSARFGEGMVNATECSETDRYMYLHSHTRTHTHNSDHVLLPSNLYYMTVLTNCQLLT